MATTLDDPSLPRPITLRRKSSLIWQIVKLTLAATFILLLAVLFAFEGALDYRRGNLASGTAMVAVSLFLPGFLFFRLVVLRYHVRRTIRSELRKRKCCPQCSYDVRASTICCPECGHPIATTNIEL